jgi:putative FmdB family regulatory protein
MRSLPTYEYACKACGDRFEVVQSFTDKPLKKHPGCGGPVQKVFHARGIVFKGSGFYATDSRSGAAKPAASSSSASKPAGAKSTSSESSGSQSPTGAKPSEGPAGD